MWIVEKSLVSQFLKVEERACWLELIDPKQITQKAFRLKAYPIPVEKIKIYVSFWLKLFNRIKIKGVIPTIATNDGWTNTGTEYVRIWQETSSILVF